MLRNLYPIALGALFAIPISIAMIAVFGEEGFRWFAAGVLSGAILRQWQKGHIAEPAVWTVLFMAGFTFEGGFYVIFLVLIGIYSIFSSRIDGAFKNK